MNPPKPTALKVVEGTYRRDRSNPVEPKLPVLGSVPLAPSILEGAERTLWRQYARRAMELRVLTGADLEMLAALVMARTDYLTLRKAGKAIAAGDAWRRWVVAMREFGMSPSSRTRVGAAPSQARDPMADLMQPRVGQL